MLLYLRGRWFVLVDESYTTAHFIEFIHLGQINENKRHKCRKRSDIPSLATSMDVNLISEAGFKQHTHVYMELSFKIQL